jgi:hypothetical protein
MYGVVGGWLLAVAPVTVTLFALPDRSASTNLANTPQRTIQRKFVGSDAIR